MPPLFGKKKEDAVSDPHEPAIGTAPAPIGDGTSDPGETPQAQPRYQLPDDALPGPSADEDIDVALSDPLEVTGSHALAEDDDTLGYRVVCEDCGGKGYRMVSVTELLGEVAGLVPDGGGDVFVKEFYSQLIMAAPYLAELFPADLLGPDLIKGQREKLWNALVELFTRYRPTDRESMAALDTALAAWGRLHANFARSDGTIRGATDDEYKAVKAILLATLRRMAGDRWNEVYDAAVGEAYDYAWSGMWFSQLRTEMTMPRYPRSTSTVR